MRPSAALRSLAERLDPSGFDAPAGRARLRLAVAGEPARDAVFVAFLAATSGETGPGRLRFETVRTPRAAVLPARGRDRCPARHAARARRHEASFVPIVAALSGRYRTIAVDLPGFGDSGKPLGAPYDAAFFADSDRLAA